MGALISRRLVGRFDTVGGNPFLESSQPKRALLRSCILFKKSMCDRSLTLIVALESCTAAIVSAHTRTVRIISAWRVVFGAILLSVSQTLVGRKRVVVRFGLRRKRKGGKGAMDGKGFTSLVLETESFLKCHIGSQTGYSINT